MAAYLVDVRVNGARWGRPLEIECAGANEALRAACDVFAALEPDDPLARIGGRLAFENPRLKPPPSLPKGH